jgi:transcription antitermination factor NusG
MSVCEKPGQRKVFATLGYIFVRRVVNDDMQRTSDNTNGIMQVSKRSSDQVSMLDLTMACRNYLPVLLDV